MRFTPEQMLAIERRKGELLLDAGAGSGKTSVLVERFARAVHEDGIGIGQILTITFTEKAAAELRERIRARLRSAGDDEAARATEGAWISTIHAFCARLLRTHALDAGLDPEFTVLDERDAAELRRSAFDAALAACARGEAGAELIAAHGPGPLRSTILTTYAELRARGALEPGLPPVPEPPHPLDLRSACQLLQELAAAVQRELGALRDPGRRVIDTLTMLERVPGTLASGRPWPGELERIRLGNGATALRSQACEDYRAALEELAGMAAASFAVRARDGLDALLREYGGRYAALKRERASLDFSDLELLARELLRRHDIGARYRERFMRVMVDEMQDTNGVQLELIDLVAGLDLFMVGDAQQSIYGFRHADVELFAERGARLERIGSRASLRTNFRSRPEILTAINGAFGEALGDGFRALLPGREDEPAAEPVAELLVVDRDGAPAEPDPLIEQTAAPWRVAEARALAARVRELVDRGEARPGDVAVLLRATTDMHVYEQALERAGLPTYVIGGRGYWAHPQVIELVSYLRALANPLDTEALYAVFLSPLCGLSLDGLVLGAAGAAEELSDADRACLEDFDAWFAQERRAAAWLGAEQLLDRALAHSGYELRLAGLPDARRRLANVRKLLRLAREWQTLHGSDLHGFVEMLRARTGGGDGARESEAPVESEALDAVRLMTIHRSKGLEFPVVCVADLGRRVLPRPGALVKVGRDGHSLGLRLKRAGDAQRVNALDYERLKAAERELELAEERRLFYVAMTRARERLIVSGAAKLDGWEEGNRLAPIGWVGAAFVPDIAARATVAGAPELITEAGVRVSFVTVPEPVGGQAPDGDSSRAPAPPAGGDLRREAIRAPQHGDVWAESETKPQIASLSYTALSTYEQCGYRFYAQRILGLPDVPTVSAPAPAEPAAAPPRPTMSAAERGNLVHELLAGIDLRNPSLSAPMPADVRGMLTGLVGSPTFARLAALRDVRREQRFSFPIGGTLITGVFDVLARERRPDQLLVLDYKSDRLAGADPAAVVAERYLAQRTIYALAALKLGAAAVEVVHLFLESPEDPVSARFAAAEAPTAGRPLLGDGRSRAAGLRRMPSPGGAVLVSDRADDALSRSARASLGRGLVVAEQRLWPAPVLQDRVELGAVDGELRAQMQPREDPEHQRERAVGAARVLYVVDVGASAQLQQHPADGGDRRAGQQAPQPGGVGAQVLERRQEQAEVQQEREHDSQHVQQRAAAQTRAGDA
jgi:ATP-dependent exoDNAse (exonuclease V) beta subunit